jgi:hypothetical protein
MSNLTSDQISAIRCAHADLVGAYQYAIRDQAGGADNGHDWVSHKLSIQDLQETFYDILKDVIVDL